MTLWNPTRKHCAVTSKSCHGASWIFVLILLGSSPSIFTLKLINCLCVYSKGKADGSITHPLSFWSKNLDQRLCSLMKSYCTMLPARSSKSLAEICWMLLQNAHLLTSLIFSVALLLAFRQGGSDSFSANDIVQNIGVSIKLRGSIRGCP